MTDTVEKSKKQKLRPAKFNPWYMLMTLHGEQPEEATPWDYDKVLHAKNRRDWNKWASRGLNDEQRKALLNEKDDVGNPRFSTDELTRHTRDEMIDLEYAFNIRSNNTVTLEDLSHQDEICIE